MVTGPVGILALQGGYQRHAQLLERLGVTWRLIRHAHELNGCAALILPGGESTTITHLLQATDLPRAIKAFAQTHPVLGTCAGLILMGRCEDARVLSLELLDADIARNAYGRQTQSFHCDVDVTLGSGPQSFSAVFIRAPQIDRLGPGVEILARHNGHAVLIAEGLHMGMSFHPELADDTRIHHDWLQRAANLQRAQSHEVCA